MMIACPTHTLEWTRRRWLGWGGHSGLLSLVAMLGNTPCPGEHSEQRPSRATRVVFFFMNGGPSHIDTFDPKPALAHLDGTNYTGDVNINSGMRVAGTLWKSDFKFQRCGESGLEISELYPELSRRADDLCIIRSMHTPSSLHAPALLQMNTGQTRLGAASLGAWIEYATGPQEESLPPFVVMLDHRGGPINGHGNWSTGKLPVSSPARIRSPEHPFEISNASDELAMDETRMQELLRKLNSSHLGRVAPDAQRQSRDRSYELAWRMRRGVPEAVNLSRETLETQQRYGIHRPESREFGLRCLLARRMLERGVRYVQIYSGGGAQRDTWDSHGGNVERHRQFAGETDRPIAAFLEDLRLTGLWDETLVIWGGEFGRTPTREANTNGRDHNPHGFSIWLAGGPIRGGQAIGATDELGIEAVETPCHVADLHATILHALGKDHSCLNYDDHGTELSLTGTTPCRVITEALA
ncbi:MAG: DUF1501 domain-containing protein [Planctomycetaceae bacterium]|nr:DUF1501 domain-containing protein [Planctomycetaceae bacterium]